MATQSPVPMPSGVNWDHAMRQFSLAWLYSLGTSVVEVARKLNKHPQVVIWHSTAIDRLFVNAEGPDTNYPHPYLWMWAFDFTYTVPPTGYLPLPGNRFIRMDKWEGIKFVKATYTRFKGQTRTRPGFLDEAMRRQFTLSRLRNLGFGLSIMVGHKVANDIADMARRSGASVTVT